ncbi:MAG: hypothetical protein EPN41_05175 [Candidimonas sp.]|nr:MAG: hypothetical protein EPN41_05175 [Candidimonas sp.]
MEKFLSWILLIVAGLLVARIISRQNAARARLARRARPATPTTVPEPMVRCAHCGVHLPRSEALLIKGETWCCEAHAKLGHRQ